MFHRIIQLLLFNVFRRMMTVENKIVCSRFFYYIIFYTQLKKIRLSNDVFYLIEFINKKHQ